MKVTPQMRSDYFNVFGVMADDNTIWNWYFTEDNVSQTIKEMEVEIESIKPHGIEVRGSGGATNYYELPDGATELRHLIHHKKMEHGIGEAFCALYRLNDNGEYLRNLNKAKYYIECAIEYYKKENNESK